MLLSVGIAFAALTALNLADHHSWMQPIPNASDLAVWLTQIAVMVCLLVMLSYGRKRLEAVLETQQQALERWERAAKALQVSEGKRSANPSSRGWMKLRISFFCNQPRGRDEDGSRTNTALPGCGGGVPGLWPKGQGVGAGQWSA